MRRGGNTDSHFYKQSYLVILQIAKFFLILSSDKMQINETMKQSKKDLRKNKKYGTRNT